MVPNFSGNFPENDPDLKISSDVDNDKHGPHFDVVQNIEGGTDQTRVSPNGDVIGGTTNIEETKIDWEEKED
jgi:hypothetical protein